MHVVLLRNTVQSVLVHSCGYSLQHCLIIPTVLLASTCRLAILCHYYFLVQLISQAEGLAPMVFICTAWLVQNVIMHSIDGDAKLLL